jgi:hypothetical protein
LTKVYYTIAGHLLAIETPSPEDTAQLLPSFTPFRIATHSESPTPPVQSPPLLLFKGNEKLEKPGCEPSEEICIEGVMFSIYHREGSRWVAMECDGVEYIMHSSADKRSYKSNLSLTDPGEQFFALSFLRIAFLLASAPYRTLKLHASVIEKGGKALIFLGKSGTGKSTHSKLWLKHVPECSLLNDDEPIVRVMDNDEVRVFGAPWSGSTPCYRDVSAKTMALVQLEQHSENILTKLSGMEAYAPLFQSAALLQSDEIHRQQVTSTVLDIAERVPVYRLRNRPDREAVALSESLLTDKKACYE